MIGSITEAQQQLAALEQRRAAVANKSYADRHAQVGPGEGVTPGHPQPDQFDRPYIEQGHAAESPQAQPPRTNPNPAPSQAGFR